MIFRKNRTRFQGFAVAGLLVIAALSAQAASVTVTTVTDQNDGAANGISLRDAVALAAPGDTILFNANLNGGTLVLTLGEITLTKNVRILGPGPTLDAGGTSRLFSVNPAVQVDIFGLTLLNGNSATAPGGGINNRGTLNLITCRLANCTSDTLGGGIYNDGGTLTVLTSTVASNNAVNGAGLYNVSGTTTVRRSLVEGNRASQDGGGLYANGGAVYAVNATFSRNRVTGPNGDGAGLFNNGTSVGLSQVTFFGNAIVGGGRGGGIYSANNTTARNTLIVGNSTTGSGPDIFGAFISGGSNFVGLETGGTGFDFTVNGTDLNLANTGVTGVQDVLDVNLRDNGGPTQTHALLTQSPARDAGDNFNAVDPATFAVLNFDQRDEGFPRIENGRVDIGAFELAFLGEGEVTTLAESLLELFNDLDTNGNHTLSIFEILVQFPGIVESEFSQLDANGNGTLAPSELLAFTGPKYIHNADTNADLVVSFGELLRVVQLFNADGYRCAINAGATEDGFLLGSAGDGVDPNCPRHASDYNPANGKLNLSELLRAVQLFQFAGYTWCPQLATEDGFCS